MYGFPRCLACCFTSSLTLLIVHVFTTDILTRKHPFVIELDRSLHWNLREGHSLAFRILLRLLSATSNPAFFVHRLCWKASCIKTGTGYCLRAYGIFICYGPCGIYACLRFSTRVANCLPTRTRVHHQPTGSRLLLTDCVPMAVLRPCCCVLWLLG